MFTWHDQCLIMLMISVQLGEWQITRPNNSDVDLTAFTDGDDSRCKPIKVREPMLLKSTFIFPVQRYFHVFLVSDSNILFGPEVPSGMCAGNPSLLMTQPSSPSAQGCNSFCDVPRTCRYGVKEETGNYIIYHFYCNCISNSCSELLLMLRPESVTGTVSICKLDV